MRISELIAILTLPAIVLAACGSGDDDSATDESATEEASPAEADAGQDDVEDNSSSAEGESSDAEDVVAYLADVAGGTAILELANGESYEFSILCALEPQEAAGSVILFTAVSYDDIGLDITQFGDEGTVTNNASITVFDSSFETLWDAATLYEPFGGSIELSLDGSTITGSGSFYPGGDVANEPVDGVVVANC
jgi:hypothetical protein